MREFRRPRMNPRKLALDLEVELDTLALPDRLPIIVQYRRDAAGAKAMARPLEVRREFKLLPMQAMEATKEEVAQLSLDRGVERIWRDCPVHTCLDTSVPLIGAPRVWEAGFRGRGVRIAIVDTGIDVQHPDLANRIGATHDITGEGFFDFNGHGTHVAGICAGSGSRYKGVAPEATLLGAKVLRSDGLGLMSGVMAGVEWAVEQHAQVINLSLGASGATDGNDALSLTCDAAVERGIVVCTAAGNDGPRPGTVGSPGSARKVITIGASNDQDLVMDFSSRGPTEDGRVKPDLIFPGYNIISLRARNTSLGHPIDNLYTEASGTSMATPHASGACALLLEAKPGIKPYQVKELLLRTAKNLGLPANTQGSGRAQVYGAYERDVGSLPSPEPPQEPPIWPPSPGLRGCLPGLLALLRR